MLYVTELGSGAAPVNLAEADRVYACLAPLGQGADKGTHFLACASIDRTSNSPTKGPAANELRAEPRIRRVSAFRNARQGRSADLVDSGGAGERVTGSNGHGQLAAQSVAFHVS